MPDDERTRRRLGDATKSRIDGLASGWSLDEPSPGRPATEVPDDDDLEEVAPDEVEADPRDSEPVVVASTPPRPDNTLDRTLAGLDARDSAPNIASRTPARADNTLDRTLAGLEVNESGLRIASGGPARADNTLDRTLAGLEVNESSPRLGKLLADHDASGSATNRIIAATPVRKDNTLDRTLNLLIDDTSGVDNTAVPSGTTAPRGKPRTVPPPPPGSPARLDADVPRLQLGDVAPSKPTKPPTKPPPIPQRAKAPSGSPRPATSTQPPLANHNSGGIFLPPANPRANLTGPVPQAQPRAASPTSQPVANPQLTGPVQVVNPRPGNATGAFRLTPPARAKTASVSNLTGPMPALVGSAGSADGTPPHARSRQLTGPVPMGEFDDGQSSDGKLRVALHHATIQHHTADALLGIPPQPATVIKETPIAVLLDETAAKLTIDTDKKPADPSTVRFERADPTSQTGMIQLDATDEQRASQRRLPTVGTLRPASMLRRKRGIWGDVRYVFTALFGLRAATKELAELDAKQAVRQTSRKHHLVTLGRTAITADKLDHPALGPSRDSLQKVEDERSKHAGAVAAADAELERVRRDREAKAKTFAADTAKAGQELADVAKKLEPLEKQAAGIKKRGAQLREQLRQIAKKISDTEQLITSVKSEKMDRASIAADIASLKADQKAVQRDEPVIAAELAEIEPKIAALVAQRTEVEAAQAERQKAEDADKGRTMELFDAIGAKRKVVERAMAEAEAKRDSILFDLGERLYVDRPKVLTPQLAPIDEIDLDVGASDRRVMELREIISNIDRWKIARGVGVLLLVAAVVAAFSIWVLSRVL